MTRAETPKGAFITFEGGEGGGKSTQAQRLVTRLAAAGVKAIATREPGGSPVAEAIRATLLAGRFESYGTEAEALLFAAARIDHLDQKIKPALAAGEWVVCDRFHDSTRAYQGRLGGIDPRFLDMLDHVSLAGTLPDLTLILDVPADVGLARADRRRQSGVADRFERQSVDFHQGLRQAFQVIASQNPQRCCIIDANRPEDVVEEAIWDIVAHRLLLPMRLTA